MMLDDCELLANAFIAFFVERLVIVKKFDARSTNPPVHGLAVAVSSRRYSQCRAGPRVSGSHASLLRRNAGLVEGPKSRGLGMSRGNLLKYIKVCVSRERRGFQFF